MMKREGWIGLGLLLLCVSLLGRPTGLLAQNDAASDEDPMAVLRAYEGQWVCEAEWAWGGTLKGRNVYEEVFDGRHMRSLTYVSDNDGPEYLRYETLYSYKAETGEYVYTTVAYDGSVETGVMDLREDGFYIDAERPTPDGGVMRLRQYIGLADGPVHAWKVSMQAENGEWVDVMDDEWERVEGE